jgi:hypothetical protein
MHDGYSNAYLLCECETVLLTVAEENIGVLEVDILTN